MKKDQKPVLEHKAIIPNQEKKNIEIDRKHHNYPGAINFDQPKDIVSELKSPNLSKPVLLPPKPPATNVQKEYVTKVKQEKVVQPKVY